MRTRVDEEAGALVSHLIDSLRYDGRRVLVVGAATGMGAAAADAATALGATVVGWDRIPIKDGVAESRVVDLADRASLDAAIDGLGRIDAIFSAAGISDGHDDVMRVNFIGHRHVIDRTVKEGLLRAGGAICAISSTGGVGWERNLSVVLDLLATPDYESAVAWVDAHPGTNSYMFSKQALNGYVARQAFELLHNGIRINAICPGPTDTPLARAHNWLIGGRAFREATGTEAMTAEQMGNAMVYLNSGASSGINGAIVPVDNGQLVTHLVGSWTGDNAMFERLLAPI